MTYPPRLQKIFIVYFTLKFTKHISCKIKVFLIANIKPANELGPKKKSSIFLFPHGQTEKLFCDAKLQDQDHDRQKPSFIVVAIIIVILLNKPAILPLLPDSIIIKSPSCTVFRIRSFVADKEATLCDRRSTKTIISFLFLPSASAAGFLWCAVASVKRHKTKKRKKIIINRASHTNLP